VTNKANARTPAVARQEAQLAQRELEALFLIAQALNNVGVAELLFVGGQTVKRHVWRILTKRGLREHVQAVADAYQQNPVRRQGENRAITRLAERAFGLPPAADPSE
jgi:ATP/maltotriose-dependent transcriptional regulator MalT